MLPVWIIEEQAWPRDRPVREDSNQASLRQERIHTILFKMVGNAEPVQRCGDADIGVVGDDRAIHRHFESLTAPDLAVERDVPFHVDEFRTLNRCLDNAISDAVTEFSFERDAINATAHELVSAAKLGLTMHKMRTVLGTATLALSAAKAGQLSLTGATGSILERSLRSPDDLISGTLKEARDLAGEHATLSAFSLAEFIAEVYTAASISARMNGCILRAPPVDKLLALCGTRDLLIAAVSNLVQNALKFTKPGTEVQLSAYALGDSINIDVADHCGGLAPGAAAQMFLPYSQAGEQRTGIGMGLTIAQQCVTANGGTLTVLDVPAHGCVFTVKLPRHRLPD